MGTFFETQCRTLFYVNIYGSYELSKSVRFLAHPVEFSTSRRPSVDHHPGCSHKPYSCSVCSKRFAHSLKRHRMQHVDGADVLACDACEKRFTTMYVCVRHADRPYSCQLCDKRFIQSHRLTNHMITHSGEKTFVCDVC